MDGDQAESQENQESKESPQPTRPSYTSTPMPQKKKSPLWIFMALAVILILGGIFFLAKKSLNKASTSPSPVAGVQTVEPQALVEPTATPAPVDKENIKIQILNGTGIPGEASYLQGKLRTLGYTDVVAANAEDQDYTGTQVTFSSSVPEEVVDEITTELKDIYETVTTKTGSTTSYDIIIITGLQKGATAKPSATSTPTPEATSASSPSASPTSTP